VNPEIPTDYPEESSGPEQLTVSADPEAVKKVLNELEDRYSPQEKDKRGLVRGFLGPLLAGISASALGRFLGSKAYTLAKESDVLQASLPEGSAQAMEVLAFLEQFSPQVIATLSAAIGAAMASAVRRGFGGESVFEYYSRYSIKKDAVSPLELSSPLGIAKIAATKLFNFVARGPEHVAFNTLIVNPTKLERPVKKLIELSDNPDKIKNLSEKQVTTLLSKGLFQLLSISAIRTFGADFSNSEQMTMDAHETLITEAIKSVLAASGSPEKQSKLLNTAGQEVLTEEKIRYWLSVTVMSSISAAKAFAMGKVFSLMWEFVAPKVASFASSLGEVAKPVTVPEPQVAEVPVPNPTVAEVPMVSEVPTVAQVPEVTPSIEPVAQGVRYPLSSSAYIPDAGVSQELPTAIQLPEASSHLSPETISTLTEKVTPFQKISSALRSFLGSPVVTEKPDLTPILQPAALTEYPPLSMSTDFESPLSTLPEVGASSFFADTGILSLQEAGTLLLSVNEQMLKKAIEQAASIDRRFSDEYSALVPDDETNFARIIAILIAAGPVAYYVINVLLKVAVCAGSIPAGAAGCAMLATP